MIIKQVTKKITTLIIFVMLVWLFIASAIVAYIVNYQMTNQYNEDKQNLKQSLHFSLTPMIKDSNYKYIQQILEKNLVYKNVAVIEVLNKNDEVIETITKENISKDSILFELEDLTFNEAKIGTINIGFTKKYILEKIYKIIFFVVLGLLIFSFVISLLIYKAIKKTVITPLESFNNIIQRMVKDFEKAYKKSEKMLEETIAAFVKMLESRDPYTAGHQFRVSQLATAIAKEMKLSVGEIERIKLAAKIHDIGKISIPAEILSFPGKLNKFQLDFIKIHPEVGYEIVKGIDMPKSVALSILQHHEKLDGTGYPEGLKGDEISLGAQIISVADVVEAIMMHRPYRASLGFDFALDVIEKGRGKQYRADVVDACLKLFREDQFEFKEENK